MKNVITYLKALWSRVAGSQRNDVEFDRRLTVGSPSGLTINWTLKLVSVLVLVLTIGSGNVWGDTYTITFKTNSGDGTQASTSTAASTCTTAATYVTGNLVTATNTYYSGESGLKLGTSKNAGDIKFNLSSDGQVVPTKVSVYAKLYNASKTKTVQVCTNLGNGTATNATSSFAEYSYSYSGSTKLSYIEIKSSGYIWVEKVVVTYSAAPAPTTVTASPSSIAFPDNTVEVGTDEATSKITLSNGYASYGNYLYGWFEDLSDEDHCEFFVNDGSTYSYSTSGSATPTLTFSYVADAAGTFTGKFIIQGYNSSYTAVNCTIPLSVTLTSSCANSVAIATGSPTNCTISASATSVSTCSGTKQVTISVTPNSCYAAPVKASVTSSGTTATWVSGPTPNSDHYDYVYSFADNATGTTTFNASLSTKTTYTVSYSAGSVPSGGGSVSGSHANDTKTCGTSMTLPGATFTTTGYTQTGWSKTNGGSQYAAVGGSYTDNAAQTFYPVWTANKYTVTWSVNGSTYTTTANVSHGSTTSTPADPSVPSACMGSKFMGWTASSSYSSDSAPGDLFNKTTPMITGNVTYYAVFADYED